MEQQDFLKAFDIEQKQKEVIKSIIRIKDCISSAKDLTNFNAKSNTAVEIFGMPILLLNTTLLSALRIMLSDSEKELTELTKEFAEI